MRDGFSITRAAIPAGGKRYAACWLGRPMCTIKAHNSKTRSFVFNNLMGSFRILKLLEKSAFSTYGSVATPQRRRAVLPYRRAALAVARSKANWPFFNSTSIVTVSPGPTSPSRTFIASGSWMRRCQGRRYSRSLSCSPAIFSRCLSSPTFRGLFL